MSKAWLEKKTIKLTNYCSYKACVEIPVLERIKIKEGLLSVLYLLEYA